MDKTYIEALMQAPSRAENDVSFQEADKRALRSTALTVWSDVPPENTGKGYLYVSDGQDWGEIPTSDPHLFAYARTRKRRMKQVRLLKKKRGEV